MTSGFCKDNEHEACGRILRKPAGKVFRCDCPCHPKPEVLKKKVEEDEEEWE